MQDTNDQNDTQAYVRASAMGIVAGLRSMAAPALLSSMVRSGRIGLDSGRFGPFGNAIFARTFLILAIGEAIADKLPGMGSRTAAPSLAVRIISGAFCGAAVSSAQDRSAVVGAIGGALGAIGASYAGYELRREVTSGLRIPDPPMALLEDAVTVWIGITALDSIGNEHAHAAASA